jgi:hypothetical protein
VVLDADRPIRGEAVFNWSDVPHQCVWSVEAKMPLTELEQSPFLLGDRSVASCSQQSFETNLWTKAFKNQSDRLY